MNLILFEPSEIGVPLPRTDRRAVHLSSVLRRNVGDTFDAGLINGPRGKCTLTALEATELRFTFAPATEAPAAPPCRISLVVGMPRPQTARDILRDATTLGVAALHFARGEKSEPSYAQSSLWSSGEWRRQLVLGAEQAFQTHLPDVTWNRPLPEAIGPAGTPRPEMTRVALDNYEAAARLGDVFVPPGTAVMLAIGAERGWSASERESLRAHGFTFAHLGERVLRTETAVIAALAIVRSKLGLM